MKKSIFLNIILAGFILSSFMNTTPGFEPGEYSGSLFFYLNEKDAPEQGSRFVLDSVRGSATIDLTSTDIVKALKGENGGIKPIKFFFVITDGKRRKIMPISSPKSLIMYDYSSEEPEETMAFIKKNMKIGPKDSLKNEVANPTMFGDANMFFNLIRQ